MDGCPDHNNGSPSQIDTNHISCLIKGVPSEIYRIGRIRQFPFSDFIETFIQLKQAGCSPGNNLLWV